MFNPVTENAHSVTDVRTALAKFGFDSSRMAGHLELVIDKFDQWTNPQGAVLYCTCTSPLGANLALARAV